MVTDSETASVPRRTNQGVGARRTEGVRAGGRSARIVKDVLVATLEVLGEVGYAALRVDEIALRSGVNKTTIYRRWPTRADLVKAALRAEGTKVRVRKTGSIREDLVNGIAARVAWFDSSIGRAVKRVVHLAKAEPELQQIIGELRTEHLAARVDQVQAAIADGQLPPGIDARLVVETAQAPVFSRILHFGEPVSRAYIAAIVDLVLAGVHAGAARLEAPPVVGRARRAGPR